MVSTLGVEFITMIVTILIRIKDFRIFTAAPQVFHFCYFCFQTFGAISIIIPSKFTIRFAWTLRILVVTFFDLISCSIIPRQKAFLTIAFTYVRNTIKYRIFVNSCTGFSYLGPKLYNMLTTDIKNVKSIDDFKTKLKGWIWNNIH